MREAVDNKGADMSAWDAFAACLHYHPVVYDQVETYHALAKRLDELDAEQCVGGNRILELAHPAHPVSDRGRHPEPGRAGPVRGRAGGGWWWKSPLAAIWPPAGS